MNVVLRHSNTRLRLIKEIVGKSTISSLFVGPLVLDPRFITNTNLYKEL